MGGHARAPPQAARSAALDAQRWRTLAEVLRLAAGARALGAAAATRALAAAAGALDAAGQEALVPLLGCLRELVAGAARAPGGLPAALGALGLPARSGARDGELLAALLAPLLRAAWAAVADSWGAVTACGLTTAFLELAFPPELFELADAAGRRAPRPPPPCTCLPARPSATTTDDECCMAQGRAARAGRPAAVGGRAAAGRRRALAHDGRADRAAPLRALAALPAGRAGLRRRLAAPAAPQPRRPWQRRAPAGPAGGARPAPAPAPAP